MDDKKDTSGRTSVRFLVDNQPYNAGESAVFADHVAAGLVGRQVAKYNSHEVKNDSNLQGLISGDNDDLRANKNKGMSDAEMEKLIDKKVEEKLKALLNESKSDGPKPPLAPAVKK